jgi:DNA polymerase-1
VLVHADYSQAEIRMLAHLAQDDKLTAVLKEGDIHTRVSCELFRVTPDDLKGMDKERVGFMRRAAKTIGFGIIYGRTPQGLAPQLGVTVEEAGQYIGRFEAMMPKSVAWIDEQHAELPRRREARSLYGRKRRFPLWFRGTARRQERQAVNMPVQSSVSDMTLLANIRAIRVLHVAGIDYKVWPHIHDGFLVQVREEDVERAWRLVAATMADPGFETQVPFVAEVSVGKTWGDCEVVWEGLRPDGLTAEDEEALEIGGAAPWFPCFEQCAEARAEKEGPVPA